MQLGNRLVTDKGFSPGYDMRKPINKRNENDTSRIIEFTNWLNQTPDAREILAEMGVEWPVVNG